MQKHVHLVDLVKSFPTNISSLFLFLFLFFFFRRDALKEQFGKEPSTVRCLAVKSALLGTRHPRKEKEAALQTVTGKPACLDGKIVMSTQSEREPSVKICKIEIRSSQPAGSPIELYEEGPTN